jgi:AraC-like DNA-binding protein
MIACSTKALPVIDRSGRYPLLNPIFDFCYRGATHVIHLYEYDCELIVDGQRYRIRSGDASCISAGSIYSLQTDEPGSHWCIHFHNPEGNDDPEFILPTHFPLHRQHPTIVEQFRHISQLHNASSAGGGRSNHLLLCEARARLMVLQLSLHNLLPVTGSQGQAPKPINLEEFDKRIGENLAAWITPADLAAHLGISTALLAKKCRLQYGCTIKQYILKKRIERAEALLATTNLGIQEVGASVGIPDAQYFNKQFRKVLGISPSMHRGRIKNLFASPPKKLATQDGRWSGRGKAE